MSKKKNLNALSIFANVDSPVEIYENELPCHVFVRLVQPYSKGWYYLGELSEDDDKNEYFYSDEVMEDIYEKFEFDPKIAEKYGLTTSYVMEVGLYKEKTRQNRPKGEPILVKRVYLWKANKTATREGKEKIPASMLPYLATKPEEEKKQEQPKENIQNTSDISALFSKLDAATLLQAIQLGLINIEALTKSQKKEETKEAKEEIKEVKKVEKAVIDDILGNIQKEEKKEEKPKPIEDVQTETDIFEVINKGIKLVKELPDIVKSIKLAFTELQGLNQNQDKLNEMTQALIKTQKVVDKLIDEVNSIKKKNNASMPFDDIVIKGGAYED